MPLTLTGFEPRTLAEIVETIRTELRSRISDKLDLSERTVLGNAVQIFSSQLADVEALLEEAYVAFDPDSASDDRLVAIALLTGVPRRGPTKGLVEASVNLQASQTYAPGDLVAHVINEPENRWVNRDTVTSTFAATYETVFESESAGSQATAPAGTLSVIAGPVSGWNAVTNITDATPGTDIESIEDLRLRRELAVASGGSRTRNAIRAKLINIDGVLSAEVFENTGGSTDSNGIPGHSIRVVVYDGDPPAADDDEIAQAIYDHKAEGILSVGSESGTAQDEVAGPQTINFTRATIVNITVTVAIESDDGVAIADVKQAILDAMPNRVGQEVTFHKLASSVFNVPAVDDYTTFTIQAGTSDLPALQSTIYLLDSADITVTGDAT